MVRTKGQSIARGVAQHEDSDLDDSDSQNRSASPDSNPGVAIRPQKFLPLRDVSKVLKPLGPDIAKNADDWPCFMVTEATIYDQKGSCMSLLETTTKGPFILFGKLEFEDGDENISSCKFISFRNT